MNSPNYYTRMFPTLAGDRAPGHVEAGVVELAKAMGDRDPVQANESEPDLPTAGYTYLGQFIDHDMTLDMTPLDGATVDVGTMANFRTPFLDLDNLYGAGPRQSPFLYAKGHRNAERFLIGKIRDDITLA